MTRVITSGVGSIDILDPPMKFTVVDVGGQRNERKKWLHCFDDVKAVVFLISLAGYNQVCAGSTLASSFPEVNGRYHYYRLCGRIYLRS